MKDGNRFPMFLMGYYGYRNLGDDLMLENLLCVLRDRAQIGSVCIDMHADTLSSRHRRVRVIAGTGLVSKARRLYALMNAQMVVWGGGTCLYDSGDNSGMRRLLRYARLAKRVGRAFNLLNIGIGRLDTDDSRRLAAEILSASNVVSFRDPRSLEVAEQLNPGGGPYFLGGDMALIAEPRRCSRSFAGLRRVGFSGTFESMRDTAVVAAMRESLARLTRAGVHIVFVPFHAGKSRDEQLHQRLAEALAAGSYTFADYDGVEECLDIVAGLDLHIGQRLHSIVAADLVGVPSVGVEVHSKVRYYLHQQGTTWRCLPADRPMSVLMLSQIAGAYVQPRAFMDEQRRRALSAIDNLFEN